MKVRTSIRIALLVVIVFVMAIKLKGAVTTTWKHSGTPTQLVFCLSSDAKPVDALMRMGAELYEIDTSAHFVYSGTAWIETNLGGAALKSANNNWVVLDSTSSDGDEPLDLDEGERTYQLLKTAIGVGALGDGEISIYDVPRNWNGARFRCIGLTDGCSAVYRVYIGTLGNNNRHADGTTATLTGEGASVTLEWDGTNWFTVSGSDLTIG